MCRSLYSLFKTAIFMQYLANMVAMVTFILPWHCATPRYINDTHGCQERVTVNADIKYIRYAAALAKIGILGPPHPSENSVSLFFYYC